jgi:NADH dehydrogenase FAD-containing subunit
VHFIEAPSDTPQWSVIIPLKEIFKNSKNVELILDSIGYIDAKKHCLASATGNIYNYDKVIFALGSRTNYFGVSGADSHSEEMQDISSTIKLRKKLVELFSKKSTHPTSGHYRLGHLVSSWLPRFHLQNLLQKIRFKTLRS